MAISSRMLKIVWAQSAGLCAFPGCQQELIAKDTHEILGHACHIIAQKPDGPRGDPDIPKELIDHADNVILLCPTHHRLVDSNAEQYTVEALRDMKAKHLMNMYHQIHQGADWALNFSQIYYMNLPRLSVLAAYSGVELDFDFMERISCLHEAGFQLGALMLRMKSVMEQLSVQAIAVENDLSNLQIGQTVSFTEKFRAKNMPTIEAACSGTYYPDSDLSRTPQVYCKKDGRKFILTLDPRWLATTTSFVNFSRGWADVAGLAIIKQISGTVILASPYILGVPKSPLDDLFSGTPPRSISL